VAPGLTRSTSLVYQSLRCSSLQADRGHSRSIYVPTITCQVYSRRRAITSACLSLDALVGVSRSKEISSCFSAQSCERRGLDHCQPHRCMPFINPVFLCMTVIRDLDWSLCPGASMVSIAVRNRGRRSHDVVVDRRPPLDLPTTARSHQGRSTEGDLIGSSEGVTLGRAIRQVHALQPLQRFACLNLKLRRPARSCKN